MTVFGCGGGDEEVPVAAELAGERDLLEQALLEGLEADQLLLERM